MQPANVLDRILRVILAVVMLDAAVYLQLPRSIVLVMLASFPLVTDVLGYCPICRTLGYCPVDLSR